MATVTAANVPEVTQIFQVLTDLPAVGGKSGPGRRKPQRSQGHNDDDSESARQLLRWMGITPILPEYSSEEDGLGKLRWFLE